MAASPSPDTGEVRRRGRQRLIGAIALVVLLVVFVPMVLDSQPRPERESPVAIPAKDNAPPLPEAPKLAMPPAAAPASASASTPPTQPPARPPEAAKAAPGVAVAPVPAAAPGKPAAATSEPAAPTLEGFAVQVGAFRDEAKLRQAREKLVAAGVVHYTERVEGTSGAITRLRAGPFPTRDAAEAAQAKLKRAALDGKVVPLP